MKKFKLLLIAVFSLLLVGSLVACEQSQGTVNKKEPYTAYEITKVDIVQKAANTFDYTITSDIAPSDTAKVYITRYDSIPNDLAAIEYTADGGAFSFTTDVKYNQYYIYVVDGDKTAVLPMTRPQMAPTLENIEEGKVLSYKFVQGTSWSSFCDPTGKSVYRSAKTVFDETAELVAKSVNIFGKDTTTDTSASEDKPYYYVVLSAKNGIVTYVSAPVMTLDKAYADVAVTLSLEEDKPVLTVSGKFVAGGGVAVELYSADEKLGKVLEIVGDGVYGAAGETFSAKLDVSDVVSGESGAGIWYDIKLSNLVGGLYDVSATSANMSQTVQHGGVRFEFKEWSNILKLNYAYYDFSVSSVTIDASKVPTLIVEGLVPATLSDVKLHADMTVDGNKEDLLWDNVATVDGTFKFVVDLSKLVRKDTPWAWFHIRTYTDETTYKQEDLNRGDALSIGQEFKYNDVTYVVKAWNGIGAGLAIQAVPAVKCEITSVTVDGTTEKPTLVFKGKAGDYKKIAIHADGNNNHFYWESALKEDGTFEIKVNLDKLDADGTPWYWFHIYAYNEATVEDISGYDEKIDFKRGSYFTVGQNWIYNGIIYTVIDKDQLVIQPTLQPKFKITSMTVDTTAAPTIVIKGDKGNYADIKIHAEANKVDYYWENVSNEDGKFEINVNLDKIPVEGTPWAWFHVYVYETAGGDATSINVERSQTGLTVGQNWTYNGIVYTVIDKDQLVIQPTLQPKFEVTSVTVDETTEKPTLVFKGKAGDYKKIAIHADGNNNHFYWENALKEDGTFEIKVNLDKLDADGTPWYWFHIYAYNEATVEDMSGYDEKIDFKRGSYFNVGQNWNYNGIVYTVKDSDQLVIQPTEYVETLADNFSDLTITLSIVDEKPILTVQGKFVKTGDITVLLHSDNENLKQEVNLKGQKVEGKAGESFTATVDLSELIEENGAGVWFDVKLITSLGGNFDANVSSVNKDQTIQYQTYTFAFAEWYGALKVHY